MNKSLDNVRKLYIEMLRIRNIEEQIAKNYSDQEMRCPVHLSIGQEASAVGICSTLDTDDAVFSTHRCHAHYLAKGGDLNSMMAEIYGKKEGCVSGRGGSMHLADYTVNFNASIPIIGSSIPLAVGAALSYSLKELSQISVAYLGDSTVEEGVFHESMNFAALRNLPVMFVCENNFYSIYTHVNERQPQRPIENVANAHAVWTRRVDGNNVLEVQKTAEEAIDICRSGKGPVFIVLDTYRIYEHCGPDIDDHLGYRKSSEVDNWKDRCPLSRLEKIIAEIDPDFVNWRDKIKFDINNEIENSFKFAKQSSVPDSSDAMSFVYV